MFADRCKEESNDGAFHWMDDIAGCGYGELSALCTNIAEVVDHTKKYGII